MVGPESSNTSSWTTILAWKYKLKKAVRRPPHPPNMKCPFKNASFRQKPSLKHVIVKLDNKMVHCIVSLFLFHAIGLPIGQGLELVDVERLAIMLVRLAPLYSDQLWSGAVGVEAECKVPAIELLVAGQLTICQVRQWSFNSIGFSPSHLEAPQSLHSFGHRNDVPVRHLPMPGLWKYTPSFLTYS